MNTYVLERIAKCQSLPSPPGIAMDLLLLCEDEKATLEKVGALISRDPALAAKLLRVANSRAYGGSCEVTTLRHALAMLGMRAVIAVALTFTLSKGMRKFATGGFDHDRFWKRAVISTTAARALAGAVRPALREEAALAALLQDIGMLALAEAVPDEYNEIAARAQGEHDELARLERVLFGMDHAAVSTFLLERWGLPMFYRLTAERSHGSDPGTRVDPAVGVAVRIVQVSGKVADIWAHPDTERASHAAWLAASAALDIERAAFLAALDEVASGLPDFQELFQVELGSASLLGTISEQARDALSGPEDEPLDQVGVEAQRDALTGLYDGVQFDRMLKQELERATLTSRPLSVVFCTLDRSGSSAPASAPPPDAGVLAQAAKLLSAGLRSKDFLGRYRGDELVVALPSTTEREAAAWAERLRRSLEAAKLDAGDGSRARAACFGVASFEGGAPPSAAELLGAAGRALSEAQAGGNGVVCVEVGAPAAALAVA